MDTNSPKLNPLLDEMTIVEKALNQAKHEYLDAEAVYSDRGSSLEQAVLREIENYRKPENQRAQIIREQAGKVERDIRRFLHLRANLSTELAMLLMQMNLTLEAFVIDALTWPASPAVDVQSDLLAEVKAFLKSADKKQANLVLSAAKAILIGMKVTEALKLATIVIKIRQGKLEQYMNEVSTVNVDALLEGINDIAKAELREEVYKAILEAAAKAVGVAAETVFPIVKVATITHELYLNIKKAKERYRRENVDDMLDFSQQVHAENETVEKDEELFRTLREWLLNEIPK